MAATDFRRIANTFVYLRLKCLEHRGSRTSGLDPCIWTLANGLANLYGGVSDVFPHFASFPLKRSDRNLQQRLIMPTRES